MSERARLPSRRGAELLDFEHGGRRWTLMLGRFPAGRPAEVFIDAGRIDPLGELAQEAAILASIALQCGCTLEAMRHALAGRSGGPLGAALELIEGAAP